MFKDPETGVMLRPLAYLVSRANLYLYSATDTILTPFSLSPMTDTAVDSLPELFLAYCILADSDDIMSADDQVVPRGSGLDPIPLLTSCALGLSSTFLSCSRR
jgi:hypothetical protein